MMKIIRSIKGGVASKERLKYALVFISPTVTWWLIEIIESYAQELYNYSALTH